MTWIFGSARIDEKGHAGWEGGVKAGDQKQTSSPDYKGEVSMQNFYNSSKGWNCFEWKDSSYALKAAAQTMAACNNAHIGYNQAYRQTLLSYVKEKGIKDLAKVDKDVQTDCSALMRCVIYVVTGVDVGNFRTVNEKSYLEKSGFFKSTFKYSSGVKLKTGTILCTCTTGHTGMIVKGEDVSVTETTTTATCTTFSPYKIKVTATELNIRDGVGTSNKIVGVLKKGHAVTIREEKDGWGRVICYPDSNPKVVTKGWICLKYTTK